MKTKNLLSLAALAALTTGFLQIATPASAFAEDKHPATQQQVSPSNDRVFLAHPNRKDRKIEIKASYIDLMRQQGIKIQNAASLPLMDLKALKTNGPSVGGGGFADSRGALPYIRQAVSDLKFLFTTLTDFEFNNLQNGLTAKFPSRQAVLEKLDSIKIGYNEQTWAIGPNGFAEELMADYRMTPQGSYIVLERRLLDAYTIEGNRDARYSLARIVLHEISHLYGVGINDDDDSLKLSQRFQTVNNMGLVPHSAHELYAAQYKYVGSGNNDIFWSNLLPYVHDANQDDMNIHDRSYDLNSITIGKIEQSTAVGILFSIPGADSANIDANFTVRGFSLETIAANVCQLLSARNYMGSNTWKLVPGTTGSTSDKVIGLVESVCQK